MTGLWSTHNLEELSFQVVNPALAPKLFGHPEDLLDCSGDHTGCGLGLKKPVKISPLHLRDRHTVPPSMVNDLPEPVWPYAKMQTLYPSAQLWASREISSKTSAWVECGSKT